MDIRKLDRTNFKILSSLNRNCRSSLRSISNNSHCSKQSVFKRIKRLEGDIILKYKLVIDSFKIGFENVYIYLKLTGIDSTNLASKIKNILDYGGVSWVAKLFGDYDLVISFRYKNGISLIKFIDLVHNDLGKSISDENIFFTRKFLIPCLSFNDDNIRQQFILEETKKKINLSPLQNSIISELEKNAKISLIKLSSKLNISPKTLTRQLSLLEKEKIILGYTSVFNYESMGYLWTSCLLKINPGEDTNKIVSQISANPKVSWMAISIEGNIMFDFLSKDYYSLRSFVDHLKSDFSREIKEYKTMNIMNVLKFK